MSSRRSWRRAARPGLRRRRMRCEATPSCTSITCCRRTAALISISWSGGPDRPCHATTTDGGRQVSHATRPYRGVFPVVPTIFGASGALDLDGQKRAVDFMIDAGSHGLCILANFSEQFVLTDDERDLVMTIVLEHVAGRVPIIVTTTHFSTFVCASVRAVPRTRARPWSW